MLVYFFDVTIRVRHEGKALDTVVYKAASAADEHSARRAVLCRYLDNGFQVVRLRRVAERSPHGPIES
ncbi:MAG TPA: hypothetical protein VG406_03590 [Isosphaeraceae bacterium]|nr:hypothetical protein [Isosphaeraceae bacterium]